MKSFYIKKIKAFALLCITLLNLGTLFYVKALSENLSYLGNELGHKLYFIFWGCSAAFYFYYYTIRLMKHYKYTAKIGKFLLIFSCAFMALSVLLPYDPLTFPELSKWHIRIAMSGTAIYVAVFFHLLFDIMKKDFQFFEKSISFYGMLVVFDILLFTFYGSVSTLLEITFTIGMAMILYWMDQSISM